MNIVDIIRQLAANAEAVRALVQTASTEQAQWKPNPDTWSLHEVMGHLYNEERGDFRAHIQEMLSTPAKGWGELQPQWQPTASTLEALESFLAERESSIDWLNSLKDPDWQRTFQVSFGPVPEIVTLSAGDVLVSWVAHDYLHIRQINELLYAWNVKQADHFKVDYAGGW